MKIPSMIYWGWGGLRKWVRLVVAGLAGHGVFDIKHFRLLTNPNLPVWLALLWIGFDLLMTVFTPKIAAKANVFGLRLLEVQGS